MAFFKTERGRLERIHISNDELDGAGVTGEPIVSEIIDYADGNQRTHVLNKYAQRFCERITKRNSGEVGSDADTYYSDPVLAATAAVDSGKLEVVDIGTMTKIKRIVASLSRDAEYIFTNENGEPVDEFEADIQEAREAGQYLLKLKRADELAVTCGASALLVQTLGARLSYQPIPSNQIYIAHAAEIKEGDDYRPADSLDLEEASVVVIQLGAASSSTWNFVAYYPRSDVYPKGRMVKYESAQWYEIPEAEAQGAVEHYDRADEIANPLTVLQDSAQDWGIPEIPVVLWYGTADGIGSELIPTDDNLFENDKEINLSECRLMTAAIKSATGVIVFSTELGGSPVMPDNLSEGLVALKPGQSLNVLNVPGANSAALDNVTERLTAYISEAYGVPSYKISIGKNTQIPSGVALVEMNKPEANYRRDRANTNAANVSRIFNIERGLAAIDNDDPSFGAGIKQTWVVNDPTYTQTEAEIQAAIKEDIALGVIDKRAAVRMRVDGMESATDEQIDTYLASLVAATAAAPRAIGRFGGAVEAGWANTP